MRILLVDDDPLIRMALSMALSKKGHEVVTAPSVAEALRVTEQYRAPGCPGGSGTTTFDIGVIDVMLPDGSGVDLCATLRRDVDLPTVILTAKDADSDIVTGLARGADDYVVKPVASDVLLARIGAVLRRTVRTGGAAATGEVVRMKQLVFSYPDLMVRGPGEPQPLTPQEAAVLNLLLENDSHVVSRAQLVDEVWLDNPPETQRVVDTTVSRLRKKLLGAGITDPVIESRRGTGYVLL